MEKDHKIEDWEYADDFYEEEHKSLSLEDFILEEDMNENETVHDEAFLKIVDDVKRVRALYNSGKTIEQISLDTNLEYDYIQTILIILNGASEDDSDVAVAHLVQMS